VQKQWITSWATIALMTGCAMPGVPGSPTPRIAGPLAGTTGQQNRGFAERVVDFVTPGSAASRARQADARTTARTSQKTDPISLGFESGPPNAELYLSMGQLSDRGGNPEHARSMYRRTLSVDPGNSEALLSLARLEDREGNLDEAVRVYHQAAAARPQDAKVLNDLALCRARQGKLQLAAQVLENAIRLDPKKQLYRNNIAKVLVETNQLDAATAHLSAVHAPAIAQYNLGVLLHQRGRNEEAVRFLAVAAQLDPQLDAASTLLSQIGGASAQAAQQMAMSDEQVLPTPMAPPSQANGRIYPTHGVGSAGPVYQSVPAQTAQAPVGAPPVALPAVR